MSEKVDCCFCVGKNWFRYRVGAVIVSDGYVLFAYNDNSGYYYTVGGGVHVGERSEQAVIREVFEETGERFKIERPLCIVENFFDGDGLLEGYDCHTVEYYYLMSTDSRREYDVGSVTTGGDAEKMCWLPIDRIDEYDIRPVFIKELLKNIPEHFISYVSDKRNIDNT